MGTTLHRKDITHDDISLIARFSHALATMEDFTGMRVYWELGETVMTLPVWFLAGSGWMLSGYKVFTMEAVGLETVEFRRVCKYLRVREPQLIDLLFRLSMLAVVPGQKQSEQRRFRQEFRGRRKGEFADDNSHGCAIGFVIERRRAEGGFRRGIRGVNDGE